MIRNLGVALVIFCFLAILGFLVIVTPQNALVQFFRTTITDTADARVITGPYPLEKDFRILQAAGVRRVISLLNPELYYEQVLLEKEQKLAKEYGMELVNYPMGSILGQRFGSTYDSSADAAARDAAASTGKVYLHCYLGAHRIRTVLVRLAALQQATGTYNQRRGERSETARIADAANAAYRAADYDKVIALLGARDDLDPGQRVLLGWAYFKKNDIANAKRCFQEALHRDDRDEGATVGLGYIALREENTAVAERYFATATGLAAGDAQAWSGLGLVHFRLGQFGLARSELQKSLELDPTDQESREVLARMDAGGAATPPAPAH